MLKYADYELDKKQTALVNIPWAIFVLIGLFFFKKLIDLVSDMYGDTQIIGLIVLLFATLKIYSFIGEPRVHFKRRSKNARRK